MPKTKPQRIRILFDRCWDLMSEFVRLKAVSKKKVKCVTCGKRVPYKKSQAGHFLHGVLDFDEMNINVQCIRCNKFLHGNLVEYYNYLLMAYGDANVKDLIKRGKKKHKYTEEELTALEPELKKKVEAVRNGEYAI